MNDANVIIDLRRVSNLLCILILSLQRRNMDEVALRCMVKIARDAQVSALQEAIAGILSAQQHSFPPSACSLATVLCEFHVK